MGHVENLRNVDAGSEQGAGRTLPAPPLPLPGEDHPKGLGNCDSAPNFCPGSEVSYKKNLTEQQTPPASVFLSPRAQVDPPKPLVLGSLSCSHEGWMLPFPELCSLPHPPPHPDSSS